MENKIYLRYLLVQVIDSFSAEILHSVPWQLDGPIIYAIEIWLKINFKVCKYTSSSVKLISFRVI